MKELDEKVKEAVAIAAEIQKEYSCKGEGKQKAAACKRLPPQNTRRRI